MIWDKVFKNRQSKICVRQCLKNLKEHGLLKQTISKNFSIKPCLKVPGTTREFLEAVSVTVIVHGEKMEMRMKKAHFP